MQIVQWEPLPATQQTEDASAHALLIPHISYMLIHILTVRVNALLFAQLVSGQIPS